MKLEDKLTAKALKLLSYRPRSIQEIKLRLEKLTDSSHQPKAGQPLAEAINFCITKLKSEKLVNDRAFAKWWVDQRLTHRPKGNFALKFELKKKGISQNIIQSVLPAKTKETQVAKKFLYSRLSTLKSLPVSQAKIKAFQWLKTRGFSFDICYLAIDEIINY